MRGLELHSALGDRARKEVRVLRKAMANEPAGAARVRVVQATEPLNREFGVSLIVRRMWNM
jgi:hypothetical protein